MLPESTQHPDIQYCSTDEVPKPQRLEHWTSVLSQALIPMSVTSDDPGNFRASVTTTALGPLRVTRTQGGAHDSVRTGRDVARSQERCYHLLVSLDSSWSFTHRGQRLLHRGDLILNDSQLEHEINIRSSYDVLNVRLPVEWLRTWIPDPDILVGYRIPRMSSWGAVLSPMMRQLRPDLLVAAPLPPRVLSDHFGAMLALVAGEYDKTSRADRVLLKRIEDCIQERCGEPCLTADQVAASLGILPRALHRQLAGARLTFATRLLDARAARALELLRSNVQRNVGLAEIARRAGFSQVPHLDRVIRKRFGCGALDFNERMSE